MTAAASGSGDKFDSVSSDVVEAKARHDGSSNFQAELLFTYGTQLGSSGRSRTICIRGPYRPEKQAAEDDADQLVRAAETEGMAKVRQLVTNLKRSRIR